MTTPVNHPKTAPSDTASRRGADWIIDQMEPDGSIRGATSINDYYKTVVGLAAAGRPHEADLMLDYVVQRFLQRDGDLDGSGCPFFDRYRIYAHAWVLMAGVLRARFDVIHPIVEFLAQFQDEETGGFYGSKPQFDRRGEQEMMTTGVVAIALLWAGRLDLALRTGQWMKRLFDAQPDLSQGLYCVWDRQQGLVTDFPSEDASMYLGIAGNLCNSTSNTASPPRFSLHCMVRLVMQPGSNLPGHISTPAVIARTTFIESHRAEKSAGGQRGPTDCRGTRKIAGSWKRWR